jgi:hypothetical protein
MTQWAIAEGCPWGAWPSGTCDSLRQWGYIDELICKYLVIAAKYITVHLMSICAVQTVQCMIIKSPVQLHGDVRAC